MHNHFLRLLGYISVQNRQKTLLPWIPHFSREANIRIDYHNKVDYIIQQTQSIFKEKEKNIVKIGIDEDEVVFVTFYNIINSTDHLRRMT